MYRHCPSSKLSSLFSALFITIVAVLVTAAPVQAQDNVRFIGISNEGSRYLAKFTCPKGSAYTLTDALNPDNAPLVSRKSPTDGVLEEALPISALNAGNNSIRLTCKVGNILIGFKTHETTSTFVLEADPSSSRGFSGVQNENTSRTGRNESSSLCSKGFIVALGMEIPCTSPEAFTGWIFKRAIAIASTATFFLIIIGGYRILISRGDPGRVQSGQETITNAIIGLVFVLTAAFLLRFIGIQIIGIPGV